MNFDVPAGACDCHTHIHGDPAKFPFFPGRVYTPEVALPEEMAALHKALHIQRVVIVTPSVYGTDNSATIYGMKARGNDARGVAVIDDKTTDAELDNLVRLGFKGIRLNLSTVGINDPNEVRRRFLAAAERVKSLNWHIQINTKLPVITAMKETFLASPVPLVFDHYGNTDEELGAHQPGFSDLVDLVRSGKAYVKISVTGGTAQELRLFHAPGANADRRQPRSNPVGHQLAPIRIRPRRPGASRRNSRRYGRSTMASC